MAVDMTWFAKKYWFLIKMPMSTKLRGGGQIILRYFQVSQDKE